MKKKALSLALALALCLNLGACTKKDKEGVYTPGAYVGVAPAEDDGVDFSQRMGEIHRELLELQRESDGLMETISRNWGEMGL